MTSIPQSFVDHPLVHTSIGGGIASDSPDSLSVTVVLITVGTHQYRDQDIGALTTGDFAAVFSVETGRDNYHLEDLARRFPQVKFLVLPENATLGDCINAAVAEAATDYLLVLRDTLKITPPILNPRSLPVAVAAAPVISVPRLVTRSLQPLPVHFCPGIVKKRFTVDVSAQATEGDKTLFPFDFIGLYQREKFIALGGFDHTITAPYWQLLDFSLRAWLRGDEIRINPRIVLGYDTDFPESDTTVNAAYFRFYLKNIAPERKNTRTVIPERLFFRFWHQSRENYFDARRLFRDARRWVAANSDAFTGDIISLTEAWDS
jgi:hypothetical protein